MPCVQCASVWARASPSSWNAYELFQRWRHSVNILDPLFRSSSLEEVFSDAERVQAILHFEAALSRAQASVGIIPEAHARAIAGKCRVENFDLNLIAQGAAHAGNLAIPIVKMLTEAVAKDDKDAARFVHWGA